METIQTLIIDASNILVLSGVVFLIWTIISVRYISLKQEELTMEYEKTFKKEIEIPINIELLDWEKYLFKKYILRRSDIFLHPIEEEIIEKKWENMKKKFPRRNRRKKLRN